MAVTESTQGADGAVITAGGPAPVLRLVHGAAAASLRVRPARRSDLPALEALVARSSADTLYRRFHGALGAAARRELRRISRPGADHRSVVAVAAGGIRGTATVVRLGPDAAELAFLVEDDWQRAGVGRALADALVEEARRMGVTELVAVVQPENWRARAFFRAVAPGARAAFEGGDVVVRIPVPTAEPLHRVGGVTAVGAAVAG